MKQTHDRKLEALGARRELTSCDPTKVVFNFSRRQLSTREEFLLSFGFDFKLPVFKLSFHKYFLSIEKLIHSVNKCKIRDGHNFGRVLDNIKSVAFNIFYNFKSKDVFSPIFSKSDFKLLKNLGQDKNVVICSPDKGRGVVILDKEQYLAKMNDIVSDSTKFQKLEIQDSFLTSVRLEDRINNFLKKLTNKNIISEETYKHLYVSGSAPGILYGLAKIHKPEIPFRPI